MSLPAAWDWNVAVFCQNEQDVIVSCLKAIDAAAAGRRVLVCLIVNGSTDESAARAADYARGSNLDFMIVTIPAGDKSNAINAFNVILRVPARTYIYVDGYVTFTPTAFEGLAAELDRRPGAVAATGVCTNGRTMRHATRATLERGGVLHGQLHAFRPEFIDRMVERGIRLPIGIYWGDGLLGSMAAHDLDARGQPWVDGRIAGVAEAGYAIGSLSLFKPADLRRQFRRMVRQARGRLQNAAIKDLIYRSGYEGLPEYADTMVRDYLARSGVPKTSWRQRPLQWIALRQLRASRPFDPDRLRPRIVACSDPAVLDRVRSPRDVLR